MCTILKRLREFHHVVFHRKSWAQSHLWHFLAMITLKVIQPPLASVNYLWSTEEQMRDHVTSLTLGLAGNRSLIIISTRSFISLWLVLMIKSTQFRRRVCGWGLGFQCPLFKKQWGQLSWCVEMNRPAIYPPARKRGESKVHIQCCHPALNELRSTNSFIKVKHYIHNLRTNLKLSK